MGFHRGTYGIELGGLFYAMDAASTRCYPGTGTVVTNLVDLGNGTQGTLTGATWSNGSFDFTTAGDRIGTGFSYIGSPYIATGNSSYTLEAWILNRALYGDTLASAGIVGSAASTGTGMQIENSNTGGSNYINFGMRSNSNFEGSTVITNDLWYHVASIRDSDPATATNKIYVNGTEVGSLSSNTTNDVDTTTAEMQIGEAQTRLTGVFDGKIAIIRLYNVAITPAQLLQNYESQKIRFGH